MEATEQLLFLSVRTAKHSCKISSTMGELPIVNSFSRGPERKERKLLVQLINKYTFMISVYTGDKMTVLCLD